MGGIATLWFIKNAHTAVNRRVMRTRYGGAGTEIRVETKMR